jgi:hypothetical protein
MDCASGYHAAIAWTGEASARFDERGDHRSLARPADSPAGDPGWPAACASGYRFVDGDARQAWQELLYVRADSGERYTVHPDSYPPGVRQVTAGASYDAWWYPADWRGPDGFALVVVCPGSLHHTWSVDMPATGGGRWTRSGDPRRAEVTASPSIAIGDPAKPSYYHGFLQGGVLTDHIG